MRVCKMRQSDITFWVGERDNEREREREAESKRQVSRQFAMGGLLKK